MTRGSGAELVRLNPDYVRSVVANFRRLGARRRRFALQTQLKGQSIAVFVIALLSCGCGEMARGIAYVATEQMEKKRQEDVTQRMRTLRAANFSTCAFRGETSVTNRAEILQQYQQLRRLGGEGSIVYTPDNVESALRDKRPFQIKAYQCGNRGVGFTHDVETVQNCTPLGDVSDTDTADLFAKAKKRFDGNMIFIPRELFDETLNNRGTFNGRVYQCPGLTPP